MSIPKETSAGQPSKGTNDQFFEYYAKKSLRPEVRENLESIYDTVIEHRRDLGLPAANLEVADIGCNAGMQCMLWAERGHHVHGIDIGSEFIELARERAKSAGLEIDFRSGTAASLPWPDACFDVCLVPELLEHVENWRECLNEFVRVVRPGGSLLISTTNRLCPIQQEFDLPLYSWYPASVKRWCEQRALTTRPEWVNHASYPAVNWFTYYSLRSELDPRGFRCADRFALVRADRVPHWKAVLSRVMSSNSLLRFVGQIATPYTVIVATKL